jgi:hypothetical protein
MRATSDATARRRVTRWAGSRSARTVGQDVDDRAARLAKHEASDSPVFTGYAISKARSTTVARTASTPATSTEMPGAAMSSLPMMVTAPKSWSGTTRRRHDDHRRAPDQGAGDPRRGRAGVWWSRREDSSSSGRTSSAAALGSTSRSSRARRWKPRSRALPAPSVRGGSRGWTGSPVTTSADESRRRGLGAGRRRCVELGDGWCAVDEAMADTSRTGVEPVSCEPRSARDRAALPAHRLR